MVGSLGRAARALRIRGLTGRWGDFKLRPVDLEVAPGEYLVVLGPSGCGKTTLMELLCGLRKPAAGQIFIDDHDITRADPADRGMGYVPQDYELFPMRSVEWNIRCAPRLKKQRGKEVEDRFAHIVRFLDVEALLRRNVQTLSGGERQRVALGRALMTDPDILVLDEPVSALPESLRDTVCGRIKELQMRLSVTTVHVSHNLDEALSVATRLAVMDIGRIVQVGKPDEILERPANRFVAELTRCRNIWPADVSAGEVRVGGRRICSRRAEDGPYWVVVRPEHVCVKRADRSDDDLAGGVLDSIRTSHAFLTRVDVGPFEAWACDERQRTVGEKVALSVAQGSVWLLPR